MSQSLIPIFFCTDNNFAVPTYIALFSMMENHREDQRIRAILLTPKDFSGENRRLIESLREKYDRLEIEFIDMNDSYGSVRINSPHVATATLYRLMIPRLVNRMNEGKPSGEGEIIDKCLYLDSDIVVEGDISGLFRQDLAGYCVGGVRDRLLADDRRSRLRETLGIPTMKDYVNAGVLLMNIGEINRRQLGEALESAGYRNEFRYNDQDAINSVCYGGIKILPMKFNAMSTCLYHSGRDYSERYGDSNIREARENPVVIHYILRRKPWSCRSTMLAGRWWKYADMQDEDVRRDYIQPFLDAHRAPLFDRVREALKTAAIYMGFYNLIREAYYFLWGNRKSDL